MNGFVDKLMARQGDKVWLTVLLTVFLFCAFGSQAVVSTVALFVSGIVTALYIQEVYGDRLMKLLSNQKEVSDGVEEQPIDGEQN